jgi:FlaA1/EpsC-like NDP-sugar epimerase
MVHLLRNRYFLLIDIILLPLVVYLSFVVRDETIYLGVYQAPCLLMGGLAAVLVPAIFCASKVYSRYWAYASLDEILLLAGAMLAGAVLVTVFTWLLADLMSISHPPRSLPVLFGLLGFAATVTPRMAVRMITYRRHWHRHDDSSRHVFIMGAGEAGAMIAQEFRRNPRLGMEVVGFLDDDPAKCGLLIHGMPVLGNRRDIPRLAALYRVQQVIIALPSAPGRSIREVVRICEEANLQTRTMPGIYELLDGKVSIDKLRKVEIEDLLRRDCVKTDISAVKALLRGRRVLITGAGGSIGSELCRQVLQCGPAELVVLGHGENSIFEIENELKRHAVEVAPGCKITAAIADLRMPDRLRVVLNLHRPQIVFHAAAHKHVPLMELNPTEAVANNVIGTRNLLDACRQIGVEHFVMISTDKAVNPTSVMGASKRAAELLVLQAARATGKPYVAVRFGNVLGSRGSVVLTFRRQIAAGGPVTVTHPEMRRFFMTIPEAVQLMLQAAILGQGGEVFTLDMGDPVKLVDLARDMIRLSGLEVGRDIDIVFTGVRPGEKLFEELFIKGEEYRRTAHEKIFISANASNFVPARLNELVRELDAAACRGESNAVLRLFHQLIPEYETVTVSPKPVSLPVPSAAAPVVLLQPAGSPIDAVPAILQGSD